MSRTSHDKPKRTRTLSVPKPAAPDAIHAADAAGFATGALGLLPDPVQLQLLRSNPHRLVLNCSRQWGKSTVTAVKAVHTAHFVPASLILVLSPSERQSAEFLRKASTYLDKMGIRPRGDGHNDISLLLPNRSRIVGLPGKDTTIRGFSSVSLLLIDEASRVSDELYLAVRPMLAASNGQLWLISTPNGRRGFFYDAWSSDSGWTRISIPATQCPRISPEFLEEERRSMPTRFFEQEYLCRFHDSEDAVYSFETLDKVLAAIPPLLLPSATPPPAGLRAARYFIGVDLGQKNDYTAIAILERATVISGPRDLVTYEFPSETRFAIRHLERLPLGTSYIDIVAHLAALSRHPLLGSQKEMIVDATGVGQAVVDLLRRAGLDCMLVPVTITGGDSATRRSIHWRVPRRELLDKLAISLEQGHLKISSELPHAQTLLEELRSLRRKPGDSVHPSKDSQHDDFVFAAALANWRATLFH